MRELTNIPGLTEDDVLISFEEFTDMVGVGTTKGYALINSGAVDARKMGRFTKITLGSARRYVRGLPKIQPKAA